MAGAILAALATVGAFTLTHRPPSESGDGAFAVEHDVVKMKPGAPPPLSFVTVPVEEGPPLPRPADIARVAAVETRSTASFAPLEGRIERIAVVLGDRVKAGQRLVLVRSGDLASMLRELRGHVIAAATKKALADRLKFLVETRAASQNDLLVAKNEYEDAQLAARAAESRLKSLAVGEEGDNLYWIVAARAGNIVQIDAHPGQHVGPNRERPVATVADLDEVLVLADVPQRETAGLHPGMVAEIHIPGVKQPPIAGRVETISEVVEADRQTVPVRIRVDNRARQLRPNAFVEAVFAPDPGVRALVVPAEAVVSDGLDAVVFVEISPGTFRRREVGVGRRAEGRVEVVSGLKKGEHIVVRGALLLLNAIDLTE